MSQQQFGQILRDLAVVLGAAGHERFAELLQRDRIDRVEQDPGISFQEENQAGGRLFQTDGDAAFGMLLTPLPLSQSCNFGGGGDGLFLGLVRAGINEMQVGLTIRTIQADDQVKAGSGWECDIG